MIKSVVDLRPAEAVFHAYAGDPFVAQVKLYTDIGPVDCTGWEWAASIKVPGGLISFDVTPTADGVLLNLDSAGTHGLLNLKPCRFDVVAEDVDHAIRTVLAGYVDAAARTTPTATLTAT